jgi:hypothetical protein
VDLLAERDRHVDDRGIARHERLAVRDHVVGVAGVEDERRRGEPLDLPARPRVVLVRVQLEEEIASVRYLETAPDEGVAVLGLPGLPQTGRRTEHVAAVGEIVPEKGGAVVEVRDAGHLDSPGVDAFPDEQVAVALGGHAEGLVGVREPRHRGVGDPAREAQPPRQPVPPVLGVGHALLHEDHRHAAEVPGDDEVARRDHEVPPAALAAGVDPRPLLAKECLAHRLGPPAEDGEAEEARLRPEAQDAVRVVRREDALVLGELPGDAVDHGRLVQRAADEEDAAPRGGTGEGPRGRGRWRHRWVEPRARGFPSSDGRATAT